MAEASLPWTSALSCPHPASMSMPRRTLTLAATPLSSSSEMNRSTLALELRSAPAKPGVGLSGIALTWAWSLCFRLLP